MRHCKRAFRGLFLCLLIATGLYLGYRAWVGWPATPMTVSGADRKFAEEIHPGQPINEVRDWLASQGIPEGGSYYGDKQTGYHISHRREDVTFKGWWMACRGNETVAECAGLSNDDVYTVISVTYPEADTYPLGISRITVYLFFDGRGRLLRHWVDETNISF